MHTPTRIAAATLALLAGLAGRLPAQAGQPATGAGDTSVFAPLELPTPTTFRSASGEPGRAYWQQRADYDIQATLDTATQTLSGRLTLRYTSHAPDTLRFIWLQVEQNAFTDSSLNAYIYPQGSRFGARAFAGGEVLDHVIQVLPGGQPARNGRRVSGTGRRVPLRTRPYDTMLFVELAQPLSPGGTAVLDLAWHFRVPEHGADRMGHDGPLYEIAQWYPRVAVYDDVEGWNTEPYVGQGEFYLEYGDFTYSVTLPAGYIVAGTGTLENPEEVLTAAQRARLAQAARADTVVHVITPEELSSGAARPRTSGMLTWRFRAAHVRDVAWAASPEYLWDAASWHGILAQAYYRPSAIDPWRAAADMAKTSIQEYSERWYPYPYPQISAVEGPVSGMEYPMLAMEAKGEDQYDLYSVVTHEVGHNWFPMVVGSNERVHFWQDEGFNTFINTFSEARRYPERGSQAERVAQLRDEIEQTMARNVDVPIEVPADRIDPQRLGFTEYDKTAVGLALLRDEILGPETFDAAFREYIRRWAFKHPTPADFFRTMDDVSGHRLDWFWREWFLERTHFDQAIDTVVVRPMGDTTLVGVAYANRARGVLPLVVRFTFTDGTHADVRYPAEVWWMNPARYVRRYEFVGKTLAKIELDPEHRLVDIDRTNNQWTARPVAAKP